jgi:ABC-2 type transport system permease protein
MNTTYLRLEIRRLFRNRQNFIITLVIPVVLYLSIAGGQRNTSVDGIKFVTYYLAGMIAFGGMSGVVAGGARISFERELGWTRQLRISPLTVQTYLLSKVLTSYLMASLTIGLIYIAGILYGVRMTLSHWVEMTALIYVGLIPFTALGILLGHVIKSDTMGPVMGGGMSLLSLLGGAFTPLGSDGSLIHKISEFVPSYWLVQAGHTSVGGAPWGIKGWVIVAAWSGLAIYGANWAYHRDTARA